MIRGPLTVIALLVFATGASGSAARSAQTTADIYSIALDGSALRRVTGSPDSDAYLSRSADGTKLAWLSTRDGETYSIYVSDADGTGVRRVASYSPTVDFREPPVWSADGRRLAYAQGFGCGQVICDRQEVWTTDVLSGQSRRVAGGAVQPAWSATRLAYTRARLITTGHEPTYRLSVILARLDGSRPHLLVRRGERPSWSPSGRFLVYRGFDGYGPTSVFRIRRDGAQRRRLPSPFDPAAAAWSPSGRHIAIVGGTLPALYVVRANGGRLRALGRITTSDSEPGFSWSPDGRRLAWPRGKRIFVQAATGGSRREISVGKDVLDVVWAADGRRLFLVAA